MKYDKLNGTSTEAVEKATGKSWDEWIALIQKSPVAQKPHKDIARWLWDEKLIKSSWWCQQVTVGYEFATDRRVRGETADQGFEVGVHKTIPVDRDEVWELMLSPEGLKLWLGDVTELVLAKKQLYETPEGTQGEIRTFKEGEFIRMTWQPAKRQSPTTLQIRLDTTGPNKTRLSFHHEKLADAKEREQMRKQWRLVAQHLADTLNT